MFLGADSVVGCSVVDTESAVVKVCSVVKDESVFKEACWVVEEDSVLVVACSVKEDTVLVATCSVVEGESVRPRTVDEGLSEAPAVTIGVEFSVSSGNLGDCVLS